MFGLAALGAAPRRCCVQGGVAAGPCRRRTGPGAPGSRGPWTTTSPRREKRYIILCSARAPGRRAKAVASACFAPQEHIFL